jgi:hypothetical protein
VKIFMPKTDDGQPHGDITRLLGGFRKGEPDAEAR